MPFRQPFDPITVRERPALFLHYMNISRTIARVRFTDTCQRRNVLASEIEDVPATNADAFYDGLTKAVEQRAAL